MTQTAALLVPVDFSPHSRAAVETACRLAAVKGAEVRLLHAMHLLPVSVEHAVPESLWNDFRTRAIERLAEIEREVAGRGLAVSTRFEERDAADAIRAAAFESNVELIVMGSHGRRGVDRLLLGSVAERTVQNPPVPVMVVRQREGAEDAGVGSILFATDFSEAAERAERIVAEWARLFGAQVEVFHAIRETAVLFAPYAVAGSSDWEGELKESALRRIESVRARFEAQNISVKCRVVYGLASEEIIERAESTGSDLIVMGNQGYSNLQRFVLGSTAARVLRHAPCHVLVAAAKSTDFVR